MTESRFMSHGCAGRNWRLHLAGLFVLLSGCTVGPDYVRPTAATPPVFKEMSSWKTAQPRDHLVRGAWWEIFGDPQLNTLEEEAGAANQSLAAAEAQYRQARALVQGARAAYFPSVSAGASVSRTRRPVTVGSGTTTSVTTSDYLLPVDASWEPDFWGKVRRGVEAARANAAANAADLETLRLSIRAELAQDYFQLRALDAQKELLTATVKALRSTLELTQNRYRGGVASRADVLQAETQLRSTEAQSIDVGLQRAQLEHAIALLIGKPASSFSLAALPLAMAPPVIPAGMPSELLERRPDIAAAERRVAAANAEIGVARAAYFPTVTLSASAGFEASRLSTWLTWPSRFWSLGAGATQLLFDGGLRGAQNAAALAAYDATVASYRQTVLTAFRDVEDNLAALRILEEEARAQDEAVKAARTSTGIATNQYKAGTVSYINVLVAQTAQLANERAAIDVLGRRMTAAILLVKALGGGWDAKNGERREASVDAPREGHGK